MELDDNTAYALASWAHFSEDVSDELLRAVTGAFALVAAADGHLSDPEVNRFLQLLRDREALFFGLDLNGVEHVFRDISGALMADPERGRQTAIDYVAGVASNEQHRELVLAAARIALLADGRELSSEQDVLTMISDALGASLL
jgi:tellurite resistance protein